MGAVPYSTAVSKVTYSKCWNHQVHCIPNRTSHTWWMSVNSTTAQPLTPSTSHHQLVRTTEHPTPNKWAHPHPKLNSPNLMNEHLSNNQQQPNLSPHLQASTKSSKPLNWPFQISKPNEQAQSQPNTEWFILDFACIYPNFNAESNHPSNIYFICMVWKYI